MEARPSLTLVDDNGEVHQLDSVVADLEDKVEGYRKTVEKQAREIGTLSRRIQQDEDPNSHPLGKEIVELVERWKQATGHPKSKTSADRVKLIKARLKDGYSLDHLELAIDGIAAFRFVVNGQRSQTGKPSQLHDRLGICLGGGEAVEKFALYGHEARKAGWTLEGWPDAN